MSQHERVVTRFLPLAIGKFKLDAIAAHQFATHIANAHAHIHIAGQLCCAPNALKSATLAVMLERWFEAISEYTSLLSIIATIKIVPAPAPQLDTAVSLLLHSRIFEICITERKRSESEALQVATLLSRALPAFWLLAQLSDSNERISRKELASVLKGALGTPLEFVLEARQVF